MHFLEKVITALQNLENHKVLLEDPVGPNEGPWLVMDPVGGNSCDPRVPWYDFWCLECKIMAMIANFSCGPFAPPLFLGFLDACLVRVKGTLSSLPENSNQQRFLMFHSRSGSLGGKFVWAFILLLLVLCIFQNSLHCTPWVIFLRIMGDFPKNVTIPRLVNDRPGDGVLELYRAATIKPRKIEPSGFFLLDHNWD